MQDNNAQLQERDTLISLQHNHNTISMPIAFLTLSAFCFSMLGGEGNTTSADGR